MCSTVFTLTEEDSNCGWSHQRKRIVLANSGCDQKGRWCIYLPCFIPQYNDCSSLQEPQSSGVQRSLATTSIPLSAVSTMSVCLEDLYWSPAQEVWSTVTTSRPVTGLAMLPVRLRPRSPRLTTRSTPTLWRTWRLLSASTLRR